MPNGRSFWGELLGSGDLRPRSPLLNPACLPHLVPGEALTERTPGKIIPLGLQALAECSLSRAKGPGGPTLPTPLLPSRLAADFPHGVPGADLLPEAAVRTASFGSNEDIRRAAYNTNPQPANWE